MTIGYHRLDCPVDDTVAAVAQMDDRIVIGQLGHHPR